VVAKTEPDGGEVAAAREAAGSDGGRPPRSPAVLPRPPSPPVKKARLAVPSGVCRACHNVSRGNRQGVSHDYENPVCTFTPVREPFRTKA